MFELGEDLQKRLNNINKIKQDQLKVAIDIVLTILNCDKSSLRIEDKEYLTVKCLKFAGKIGEQLDKLLDLKIEISDNITLELKELIKKVDMFIMRSK